MAIPSRDDSSGVVGDAGSGPAANVPRNSWHGRVSRPASSRRSPDDAASLYSERIVERLGSDPNFTEEQRERLEALFAERENLFRQFNLEMRERFETEQSSLHADIAAILTPVQRRSSTPPAPTRPYPGQICDLSGVQSRRVHILTP